MDLPRKQKHRLATFQFIILKIDMEPACAAFHKAKHIIVILMLICNRHLYSLPRRNLQETDSNIGNFRNSVLRVFGHDSN